MADTDNVVKKLEALDPQYRETILVVLEELLDVLNGDGAGVFFSDAANMGQMSVHLFGDPQTAAGMIAAAPAVYERVYGVPDGEATH